jgi:hypothetical protein
MIIPGLVFGESPRSLSGVAQAVARWDLLARIA